MIRPPPSWRSAAVALWRPVARSVGNPSDGVTDSSSQIKNPVVFWLLVNFPLIYGCSHCTAPI